MLKSAIYDIFYMLMFYCHLLKFTRMIFLLVSNQTSDVWNGIESSSFETKKYEMKLVIDIRLV